MGVFLLLTLAGGIPGVAAGLYFLTEVPEKTAFALAEAYRKLADKPPPIVDEKSASRAIERFLIDLNERIHPETNAIIRTFRNYLLAQKLETIAQSLKIQNRKPEVAITVGPAHHGIERTLLKSNEKRVKWIGRLLKIPGLKKIREEIATIARFDYNKEKDKWELTDRFKDPYLSKIEK